MNHFSYPLTIVQIKIFEEPQNFFLNQNSTPQNIEPASPPRIFNCQVASWGQIAWGKASSQPNNVSGHRNELFSKETLTNSYTVCHIVTSYKYVENIKTRINFLGKRQIT